MGYLWFFPPNIHCESLIITMDTTDPIYELFEGRNPYQKWRNRRIKGEKEDTLVIKLHVVKQYFNMCFDFLKNSWTCLLINLVNIRK